MRRRTTLALLAVASAALAPSCDQKPAARACVIAPPAVDFRLVADGTSFRDSLGRVVFLRGVNAGGRSKFAPYVPFDFGTDFDGALAEYMDRAASWGIDVMRVPFTWAALEPVQGQDDAQWLSRYDAILDAAWARGIWTVVDFHQDVYAENFCGDGFPDWTIQNPPAPHHDCPQWSVEYFQNPDVVAAFDAFWAPGSTVQDEYFAAWDVMIARYKDKPGVLGFEPINEPSSGSAPSGTFEATTLTDFYSKFVARARAAAPNSLVFCDTTGLDGVGLSTSMTRPAGDGVVFAPHFYPISSDPDAVLGDMQVWQSVGSAWNVPVFVGEFGAGDDDPSTLPRMQATFSALDAYGFGGAEWEYSVSTDVWNDEHGTIVAADGTEYPVAQAVIRPYARAVAGSAIATAFDAPTSTFTLSYAPDGGVTAVAFPTRAYPTGYDVDLQGACYDASSVPGQMLIQPDPGATEISLTITPR
jgi:endoglycosylceramidase